MEITPLSRFQQAGPPSSRSKEQKSGFKPPQQQSDKKSMGWFRDKQTQTSKKKAPTSRPVTSSERVVYEILREACNQNSQAILLIRDSARLIKAQFKSMNQDFVRFSLPADTSTQGIFPLTLLCVSFVQGTQAIVFLAPVRELIPASNETEHQELVLGVPTGLIREDVRSSFRVPVLRGCGLQAKLWIEDMGPYETLPLNLSLGGALLRFDDGIPASLRKGLEIEVELSRKNLSFRCKSLIRRVSGHQLALQFQEQNQLTETTAPEPLAQLVKSLERYWLSEKSG